MPPTDVQPADSAYAERVRGAYAVEGGREKLIATMSATMMTVAGRDDVKS